jgi:hypothetical protein
MYFLSWNTHKAFSGLLNAIGLRIKLFQEKHSFRYKAGSKSFRADIQKPRQIENSTRDI